MWRVEFFKIGKRDFTFIREMRVEFTLELVRGLNLVYTIILQKAKAFIFLNEEKNL